MSDKKFTVIGLSDSNEQFFAPEVLAAIRGGKVFSGGKRHHELVAHLMPADAVWIDISVPLEDVYDRYLPYREIVVFASGDPLFYGFAVTLQREFPNAEIAVFPLLIHCSFLPIDCCSLIPKWLMFR